MWNIEYAIKHGDERCAMTYEFSVLSLHCCNICLLIKGILNGIPWQLIRHSVIPFMVEKELWIEMINMLWIICLFLCVCTGQGGIVASRFVEICIIVTDTDSFPHKRIILQCSLLL